MTDESTNWVTLKVPESDREKAADHKPDGATWGDCVVQGALRLSEHADEDVPNVSGSDAQDIMAHLEDALDTASMASDPGATEEAVDDLTREVRKAQELAEQARDAAQRVEEGMGR